jgi:hypothetical protein
MEKWGFVWCGVCRRGFVTEQRLAIGPTYVLVNEKHCLETFVNNSSILKNREDVSKKNLKLLVTILTAIKLHTICYTGTVPLHKYCE